MKMYEHNESSKTIHLFVQMMKKRKALRKVILSLVGFIVFLILTIVIFEVRGLEVFVKNPILLIILAFGIVEIGEMNLYSTDNVYKQYWFGYDSMNTACPYFNKTAIMDVITRVSQKQSLSTQQAMKRIAKEICSEAEELYYDRKYDSELKAIETNMLVSRNMIHIMTMFLHGTQQLSIVRTISIYDNYYSTACYDNHNLLWLEEVQLVSTNVEK